MKKSKPNLAPIRGNVTKYESYKEAWTRIKQSQSEGFFLEAIAIEESIITDRLVSYLTRPESLSPIKRNKNGNYPPFGKLIRMLDAELGSPLAQGEFEDLCDALNKWREKRNQAVHAFVVSEPGTPTIPVDLFLKEAKEAAKLGKSLAATVSNWHRKSKREKK